MNDRELKEMVSASSNRVAECVIDAVIGNMPDEDPALVVFGLIGAAASFAVLGGVSDGDFHAFVVALLEGARAGA